MTPRWSSEIHVEFQDSMGSDMDIALAAWVSTMGQHADEADPARVGGLINFLSENRHGSPFEHTAIKHRIGVPIFTMREHMRHRIGWSYNEWSGRYDEMEPHFYLADVSRGQSGKPGKYIMEPLSAEVTYASNKRKMEANTVAWEAYLADLEAGVAKELARIHLPLNMYTWAIVTCNARSMMHFLSLRTGGYEDAKFPSFPMFEIEAVAVSYEMTFKRLFPLTYKAFCKNGRVCP